MGFAQDVGRSLPGAGARMVIGTVVSGNAGTGTLTVNVGGTDYTDLFITDSGLAVDAGDSVVVMRQDDWMVVVGAVTQWLPPHGTVTGSTATAVTVSVPGHGSVTLPFLASYSPTNGDVVAIMWHGTTRHGVVVGKLSTSPTTQEVPAPKPNPPLPQPRTGTTTFPARSVGTYRSGTWRTDANGDVIQGTAPGYPGANEGAWFYHGAIKQTLSGATVTAASIYLGRTSGGVYAGQACHLQRVTNNTRPGGALTFSGAVDDVSLAVGQTGWFSISTAIVQALVTSGGSIGIRAPSGPYMRMYGLSKSSSAGALRISWRR
jgi:hypothetical protein